MKVELLEIYEECRGARGVQFFIWGEGYPKLWKYAPLREAWAHDGETDSIYLMSRPVPELVVRASQYVRRTRRRANAGLRNGA